MADVLPEVEDGRSTLGDDGGDAQRRQFATTPVLRVFFQDGLLLHDRVGTSRTRRKRRGRRRRTGRRSVVESQVTGGNRWIAAVHLLWHSVSFEIELQVS